MGLLGSDKSTLLYLIDRLNDITDGNIFINGKNRREVKKSVDELLKLVGLFERKKHTPIN